MVTHSAILLLWSVYFVPHGCRSRGSDMAITRQTVGDSCSLLVVRGTLQPPEHTLGTRRAGPCRVKPRAGE